MSVKRAVLVACLVIGILTQWTEPIAYAAAQPKDRPRVLVAYSDDTVDTQAAMIRNLLGHFHVSAKTSKLGDATANGTINLYDYVIFFDSGLDPGRNVTESALRQLAMPVLWIGAGDRNRFLSIISVEYKTGVYPEQGLSVNSLTAVPQDEILCFGSDGTRSVPLIARNGRLWKVAFSELFGTTGMILADMLHEFLEEAHPKEHEGFILIQKVHPLVDPQKLKDIARSLKARKLPFLIAVTPIYVNPYSGQQVAMHEKPEFVNALHEMTAAGGSIVLNGVTHQYKDTETGNGYEFWDAYTDSPIAHEDRVVKEKLETGIALLAREELYPLAFEAPLYAMSQQGYRLTGQTFTTLIGQIQPTDNTYTTTQRLPYRLNHSSFHGMNVIPDTLGPVTGQIGMPEQFRKSFNRLMLLRDSFVGIVFHADLPVSQLDGLLDMLKNEPIRYIDLVYERHRVKTSFVSVESDGSGNIQAAQTDEARLKQLQFVTSSAPGSLLPSFSLILTWSIAIVVLAFIIMFVIFLVLLRRRRRYRLFAEKEAAH